MSTTDQNFGKQIIGPVDNPYMVRYILFRRWHLPRVYVHKFCRSDDERAPHNHPWWFVSLILRGSYLEYTDKSPNPIVRKRFSFAYRPLSTFHRVALPNGFRQDMSYGPMPCWSIVITGPDVRGWGFRCPRFRERIVDYGFGRSGIRLEERGFHVVPWREFDGCGE